VRLTRGFSSLEASTIFICSFALACAAICAVPGIAHAQDSSDTEQETYIWPLERRYALTSTFAEYRSGHFHAGVDISTGGRTGLPVRAVAAGHVWRVRASPFGYGKSLYIKQRDGRYAVYAHLEEFKAEIAALVRKEQWTAGQYEVDIYAPEGEYPVQRGEVIGLSGRSGSPAPHLHLELRDSSNRPINPLTHGFSVPDSSPPRFVAACIYPVGSESRVNGERRPYTVKLKRVGEGDAYRPESSVRVNGKFALSAHMYDEQDPDAYTLGPWRLETFLDDQPVFATSMERFSYERTQDVGAAFDYRLVELGIGRFLRQFAFAGYPLEIHARQAREAGVIDASGWDGTTGNAAHTVKFVATDAAGNRAEAALDVFRNDEPVLTELEATLQEETLHLGAAADDPDGTVTRVRYKVWEDAQGVIADTSCTAAANGVFAAAVELPGSATASDLVVEAVAEDDGGVMSPPRFAPANVGPEGPPPQLSLRKEWYDNSLFLTIESDKFLESAPQVSAIWSGLPPVPVEAAMQTPRTASCVYTPEMGGSGALIVSVRAFDLRGRAAEATWSTNASTVSRATGGTVSCDGILSVQFPQRSVYQPILARIEQVTAKVTAKMPPVTRAYKIEPVHEPLDGKVTLTFALADGPLQQAGIYMHTRNGKWNYLTTQADESRRLLTASAGRLGTYVVLRDTIAPTISAIRPRPDTNAGTATPKISASVEDTGSGIDYKEIEVYLDGALLICEYDPFRNTISHQVEEPLGSGKHTMSISLRDYAGNDSLVHSTFTVP
jgi:murein DD-endopeptidase MepM/ murein hydrolase activator NlpD